MSISKTMNEILLLWVFSEEKAPKLSSEPQSTCNPLNQSNCQTTLSRKEFWCLFPKNTMQEAAVNLGQQAKTHLKTNKTYCGLQLKMEQSFDP